MGAKLERAAEAGGGSVTAVQRGLSHSNSNAMRSDDGTATAQRREIDLNGALQVAQSGDVSAIESLIDRFGVSRVMAKRDLVRARRLIPFRCSHATYALSFVLFVSMT